VPNYLNPKLGRIAGQAWHAAGLAFRAGALATASRLLNVARQADPSQAGPWAELADRVQAAARAKAAEGARPDDPRSLAEILAGWLEGAEISADDPAARFVAAWNAWRYAAADEPQPGQGSQHAAEPLSELENDPRREAGQ
jgi:hypothetical protein